MALQYLFDPNKQFQSLGGVNEVSGFLRIFLNGTDDRATTYKNFDGTLNEADIVLDSYGRAVVIVDDTKTYRIEVYNRLGGLMWTVSNYKARGGSGGGTGTPVSVEGTVGEIDVYENTEGGVKHFVVGLAATIKNAIATLTMAVNGVANALNGKKDKQTPVNVSGATTKTLVGISQDSDGVMTAEFDDIAYPDYSQRFENIENEQTVDERVIAAALNDLNARMEAVEDSQDEKNIGDRIAESLDSQNLFEGGIRVKVRQPVKNFFGSATKTVTSISQDANGEMTPTFSDIDFDSKVLSFYPQSLGYMTPDERAALNAKMQEVVDNGGIIILLDGRGANFPCVLYYYNTSEYYFYRIEKNVNGIDYFQTIVTYDSDTKTFNVDQSSTTIDPALYEKNANKKTTITGNETSTTYYPNMKAVVDFVNGMLQNLGGKLITDNGDPFTDSANLPATTPFQGVNISNKDYAYIQDTGTAERWSAIVSGSSVTWQQEYAISIPVFTPSQQAAINSGATSTKVGNYDAHLANTNNPHHVTAEQVGALTPTGNGSNVTATFTAAGSRVNISTGEKLSVIFGKIAKWFADLKAVAFSGSYTDLSEKPDIPAAANDGVLTIKQNGTSVGTFSANQSRNTEINVTDTTKVEINNNTEGNLLFTTRSTSGDITPYTGNNLRVDTTKGFTGVMAGTVGADATLGFNIDVSGFNNHIIPTSYSSTIRDFLSKVKKLQVDMDAAPKCVPIDCDIEGHLTEQCFYTYIYKGEAGVGVPVRLTLSELWRVVKGFIGSTSATGLGLDKDYYQGTAYNAIYDDDGNQIKATYATRTALSNKSTSAYNELNTTTPDANMYLYFEDVDMFVRLEIKQVSDEYYYGLVMKRNISSSTVQVSGSAMLSSQASGQPSPSTEIKRIWTSVNNVSWSNFGHFGILQANASADYAATGKIQFKCGTFMISVDVSITKAGADDNAYVFMTGYTSPCVAGHNKIPVV